MEKITPFLWFDDNVEEAVNFYVSIFKNSRITAVTRYDEESAAPTGKPAGSVMTVSFLIEGQEFIALNGGPHYTFSPATSFMVTCATQEEIDHLWENLSTGGQPMQCGWVTDRFGVTWQVVPTILFQLMQDPNPVKARKVMASMLQMVKFDIEELQRAHQ